jgi:octaprenyl-diphosphate synthase
MFLLAGIGFLMKNLRAVPSVNHAAGALDRLTALVEGDLRQVNALILEQMQSPVALIPQLAGYILSGGGKRLRPVLTLAAARLCGATNTRAAGLAAAVELIHTATLLHDDVVDESAQRRGQASANNVFGNEASVLVGDFLFSRAFTLMTMDGSIEVLRILSHASAVIAEGEVLQLAAANNLATTRDLYLDVINAKTAALFAAACQVGGLAAGRPDLLEPLGEYGRNLGMAFQIADDVLDYVSTDTQLGKAVGDDLRDGKVTLPVIIAYQQGDEAERAFWRKVVEDQEIDAGSLDLALILLRKYNAPSTSLALAQTYAETAKQALDSLPDNVFSIALRDAADFCVERDF